MCLQVWQKISSYHVGYFGQWPYWKWLQKVPSRFSHQESNIIFSNPFHIFQLGLSIKLPKELLAKMLDIKAPVQTQKGATLPFRKESPSAGAATSGNQKTQPQVMAKQVSPAFTLHNTGTGLCLGLTVPVTQNGTWAQKDELIHDAQPSSVPTAPVIGSSTRVPVLQNDTLTQLRLPSDQETLLNLVSKPTKPSHPCALDHTVLQQIPHQPTAPGGITMPQPSSVNTLTPASTLQGEVPYQDPSQFMLLNSDNQQVTAGSIQGPQWSNAPSDYACPHHQAQLATDGSTVPSSQVRQAIITWLLAQQQQRQALTQSTASLQTPVPSVIDLPTQTSKPCQMLMKKRQSSWDQSLDDGDSGSVSKGDLKSISHICKQQLLAVRTSHSTTTGRYTSPEFKPKTLIHDHPASHGSDTCGPHRLQPSRRQSAPSCPDHSITMSRSLTASRSLSHLQCDTSPGLISTQGDTSQVQQLQFWPQARGLQFLLQAGTGPQFFPGTGTGNLGPDNQTAVGRGTPSIKTPESTPTPSRPVNLKELTRSPWPLSLTHSANCPELPSTMIPEQPDTSCQLNHHGPNHVSNHQGLRPSDSQEPSVISGMESGQLAGHQNEHKLSNEESSSPSCNLQPNEILDRNKLIEALNYSNVLSYSQSSSALPEHHPESDQNSSSTHSGKEEVKDSTCETS